MRFDIFEGVCGKFGSLIVHPSRIFDDKCGLILPAAFTLDGVNLKGYFAYALSDQRDPGFGLYGHVHEEAVVKASLANYRNIIRHNGFPVQGAPAQRCPLAARPCPGCQALAKRPVVGFLTLLGSATLLTLALVVYYASRRHKDAY